MNAQELATLLNFVQQSPDCDALTATVLTLAADSAALKKLKNRVVEPQEQQEKILKFTKKEIDTMPDDVKRILIINGNAVPYREVRGMYQVRYHRDGYHIDVASKSLKVVRQKFIDKLIEQDKAKQSKYPLIKDFAIEWFKVIKPVTKELTYNGYVSTWRTHIIPTFGHLHLDELTRDDIQTYIYLLAEEGKNRTAKKVKQQLGASYKIACNDYNIRNPLVKVILPRYQVEKGEALSYEDERKLVDFCIANKHLKAVSAILTLLYTGMRSGELDSLTVVNDKYFYIDCITEKTRQGLPDVHRQIPVSPMFKKVLQYVDFEKAKSCSYRYIDDVFKMCLPKRKLHELRYTFISRCKECRCSLELVMLWSGHTDDKEVESSKVNRGYTTYSDSFYFDEIERVIYEF
ncbi:MAG: site-specific integrase [Lachnospiraceae bacterium]|nr:site-specific integrase [Lachnospiraceae bacterium]